MPVLISVIHPDTPASRSGQLYVGDAILTVNGVSLKEVSLCNYSTFIFSLLRLIFWYSGLCSSLQWCNFKITR